MHSSKSKYQNVQEYETSTAELHNNSTAEKVGGGGGGGGGTET